MHREPAMRADILLDAVILNHHFKVPEHAILHWVTDMEYERLDSLKHKSFV